MRAVYIITLERLRLFVGVLAETCRCNAMARAQPRARAQLVQAPRRFAQVIAFGIRRDSRNLFYILSAIYSMTLSQILYMFARRCPHSLCVFTRARDGLNSSCVVKTTQVQASNAARDLKVAVKSVCVITYITGNLLQTAGCSLSRMNRTEHWMGSRELNRRDNLNQLQCSILYLIKQSLRRVTCRLSCLSCESCGLAPCLPVALCSGRTTGTRV